MGGRSSKPSKSDESNTLSANDIFELEKKITSAKLPTNIIVPLSGVKNIVKLIMEKANNNNNPSAVSELNKSIKVDTPRSLLDDRIFKDDILIVDKDQFIIDAKTLSEDINVLWSQELDGYITTAISKLNDVEYDSKIFISAPLDFKKCSLYTHDNEVILYVDEKRICKWSINDETDAKTILSSYNIIKKVYRTNGECMVDIEVSYVVNIPQHLIPETKLGGGGGIQKKIKIKQRTKRRTKRQANRQGNRQANIKYKSRHQKGSGRRKYRSKKQ